MSAHVPSVALTVDVADRAPTPDVVGAFLDHLDCSHVRSTWFLPGDVDRGLVDRLFFTGHEVAALVPSVAEIRTTAPQLAEHDVGVVGARVPWREEAVEASSSRDLLEVAGSTGLSYLSIPAASVAGGALDGRVLLRERSLFLLAAPTTTSALGVDPMAWLHLAHIAVGRVLEHHDFLEIGVDLRAMNRAASFNAVAETVDLVSGLQRAERLRSERLDRLLASVVGTLEG